MKRETLFLRIALFIIGLPVLALWMFGLPWLIKNPVNPNYAHILYPIIIGICASSIPYYIALYKAFRLLGFIDKNIAFSELSVKALRVIKYCAIIITTLYALIMPFFLSRSQIGRCSGSYHYWNDTPFYFSDNRSVYCRTSEAIKERYRYKSRK
jgi:hypothetical protein